MDPTAVLSVKFFPRDQLANLLPIHLFLVLSRDMKNRSFGNDGPVPSRGEHRRPLDQAALTRALSLLSNSRLGAFVRIRILLRPTRSGFCLTSL